MAFTETLNTFLNDFGVTVVIGATTVLGIEDAAGVLVLENEQMPGVQATVRTLLIRTDQKGALVPGSTLTVNSVSRTVISILPFEDGAFTLLHLR